MPRIMPKDSSRPRTRPHSPPRLGRCGARQMRSSASCSSANTEVAPMNSTMVPTSAALTLWLRWLTLSSSSCTAAAPVVPSMPTSWP